MNPDYIPFDALWLTLLTAFCRFQIGAAATKIASRRHRSEGASHMILRLLTLLLVVGLCVQALVVVESNLVVACLSFALACCASFSVYATPSRVCCWADGPFAVELLDCRTLLSLNKLVCLTVRKMHCVLCCVFGSVQFTRRSFAMSGNRQPCWRKTFRF